MPVAVFIFVISTQYNYLVFVGKNFLGVLRENSAFLNKVFESHSMLCPKLFANYFCFSFLPICLTQALTNCAPDLRLSVVVLQEFSSMQVATSVRCEKGVGEHFIIRHSVHLKLWCCEIFRYALLTTS